MTVGSVGCLAVVLPLSSSMMLSLCPFMQCGRGLKGDQANTEEHHPPQIKTNTSARWELHIKHNKLFENETDRLTQLNVT